MHNAIGARGFHHLALAASDFDRSLEFYRDGLGLEVFRAWGVPGARAVMLDAGNGNCLEIFERPGPSGDRGGGGDGAGAGASGASGETIPASRLLHLAFRVDDCRAAHHAVQEAGGREKQPPRDVDIPSNPPYAVTISFLFGPDGEEIELFEER
jgi:catechol 2,3-dioxygenase-like lactoylglutathione lyase family enzyme